MSIATGKAVAATEAHAVCCTIDTRSTPKGWFKPPKSFRPRHRINAQIEARTFSHWLPKVWLPMTGGPQSAQVRYDLGFGATIPASVVHSNGDRAAEWSPHAGQYRDRQLPRRRSGWPGRRRPGHRNCQSCEVRKVASPIEILDWLEGSKRLILCDACRGLARSVRPITRFGRPPRSPRRIGRARTISACRRYSSLSATRQPAARSSHRELKLPQMPA